MAFAALYSVFPRWRSAAAGLLFGLDSFQNGESVCLKEDYPAPASTHQLSYSMVGVRSCSSSVRAALKSYIRHPRCAPSASAVGLVTRCRQHKSNWCVDGRFPPPTAEVSALSVPFLSKCHVRNRRIQIAKTHGERHVKRAEELVIARVDHSLLTLDTEART